MQAVLGGLATGAWAELPWRRPRRRGHAPRRVGRARTPGLSGLGAGLWRPRLVVLTEPQVERRLELELLDDTDDHHLNLVIEADAPESRLDLNLLQAQRLTGLTTTTSAVRVGRSATFNGTWLDGNGIARHDVQVDLSNGAATRIAGLVTSRRWSALTTTPCPPAPRRPL